MEAREFYNQPVFFKQHLTVQASAKIPGTPTVCQAVFWALDGPREGDQLGGYCGYPVQGDLEEERVMPVAQSS